jgi:8-oxo-dGTP pyrophosphatase MutT (NUDIX family)
MEMFQKLINTLTTQLNKPLEGKKAHVEMAHASRVFPDKEEVVNYRSSAVIVLLYPNQNKETCVLLIERSTYEGHHSGQIALPGGKREPADVDLQATALREFFEETGSSETPYVIGKLSEVYIPVSKFIVQPYVAYLTKRPDFIINDLEVYKLIEWELNELLEQNTIHTTTITISNVDIVTPYFLVDEKILWGATAMIINELKHVIKDSLNL